MEDAVSLVGHRPSIVRISVKNEAKTQKLEHSSIPVKGVVFDKIQCVEKKPIRALAMELTKEMPAYRKTWSYLDSDSIDKPGLWPPENKVDKPSLHNPLLRQERMGYGWL
ncbi:unnamed protein product, partial [Eruca vesicaria subsp. sativa]|nr:unnamed protein product [Eruca vesicaria subsp. sativa]